MGLETRLTIAAVANLSDTLDLGPRSASMSATYKALLADGVAAGQANRVFHDRRTLVGAATENLDLAGGSLLDPLGNPLTFARIKGLIVSAVGVVGPPAVPNTNDVIVGGDVTNTFFGSFADETDAVRIRPGGTFAIVCGPADGTGYVVAAGTGDLLKFTNGAAGTDVTFDVIIIGTSA
jgi:hypothetical protein